MFTKHASNFLMVFGLLVIVAGCTSANSQFQSGSMKTVETVMQKILSGPSDEPHEYFDQVGSEEGARKLMEFYDEEFKEDFTESYYDDAIANRTTLLFHQKAYSNEATLKVKKFEVDPVDSTDGAYQYEATIEVKRADDTNETVELSGRVNVNEDGKISRIRFNNLGVVLEVIGPK